jgi:hypothetical protein
MVEIVPALPEEVAALRARQLAAIKCLLEAVSANRAEAVSRPIDSFKGPTKPDHDRSHWAQGGAR